jgi:hypothetical protein
MLSLTTHLFAVEESLMPWSGLMTGFFSVFAVRTYNQQQYLRSEILSYLAATGILGITLWWSLPECNIKEGQLWVLCLTVGLTATFLWYRFTPNIFGRTRTRLTKHSDLERVGRTDVRKVAQQLPQHQSEYDPRTYHRSGDFFMGLGHDSKPIYWNGRLPHIAIAGTSGSGKGRKLQDIAAQSVLNGEALIYLDPKDDEWGPHALYSACAEHEKQYHYLSLLPESPAQINILAGAKAWEIEELFTATLGLADSGKASDFYKNKDRNAAHEAAILAHAEKLTIAELYNQMSVDAFWQEDAPGFLGKLREMAGVTAINAKQSTGLCLTDLVADGGGLYVVGSMTIQAVRRAQQMIFVRIQQIATSRDRMKGELRTVCVIADETKYHISRPVLQGLGASRDKGMRVVLAFQSFADLRDCPADMTPDMVVGAIIENTPCKLIYKIEDPDTADWLARKSGVILVDDETRMLEKNIALAETTSGERSIRQAEHYLFDANKLTNLATGWSVLFGQGLAQYCYVSPYRVNKSMAAITPVLISQPVIGHNHEMQSGENLPSVNSNASISVKSQRENDFFSMEQST